MKLPTSSAPYTLTITRLFLFVAAMVLLSYAKAQAQAQKITIDTALGEKLEDSFIDTLKAGDVVAAKAIIPAYLAVHEAAVTRKDSMLWRRAITQVADKFRRAGYYTDAQYYYQQGLVLVELVYGRMDYQAGKIYYNLGVCSAIKNAHSDAIEYFELARVIFEAEYKEDHHFVGAIYNALGNIYSDALQYQKALTYYQKALVIYKNIGSERRIGLVLDNIGVVYKDMKKYDEAILFYDEAISMLRQRDDDESELLMMSAYFNKAGIYYELEDIPNTKKYLYQLKSYHENNPGHPIALGDTYRSYAELLLFTNQLDSAEYYGRAALDLYAQELPSKHPHFANTYIVIGDIFEQNGNLDSALIYYQKAIISSSITFNEASTDANPLPRDEIGSKTLLKSLIYKTNIYQKKYQANPAPDQIHWLKKALRLCLLMDQFVQQMRRTLPYADQIDMINEFNVVFNIGVDVSCQLLELTQDESYKKHTYYFSERKKASALSNIMNSVSAKKVSGIPDHLLKEERRLAIEINYYNTEIQLFKQDNGNTYTKQLGAFYDSLFVHSSNYDALLEDFKENYPRYFQLKHNNTVITPDSLSSMIDEDEVILSYSLDSHQIIISVVGSDGYRIVKKAITKDMPNLEKLVYRFYKTLQMNNLSQYTYRDKYIELSYLLYQYLIEPARPLLQNAQKITIIPEGILYYLPFEALLSSDQEVDFRKMPYLLRDFEITYHYSMSIMAETKNNQSNKYASSNPPRLGKMSFLGIAPVFDRDTLTPSIPSRVFGTLLRSLQEVTTINKYYQQLSLPTSLLVRGSALESSFKRIAQENQIDVIHLSSHSAANSFSPNLSWIAFFNEPDSNTIDDGFLYAGEIYNLALQTDLLVLSSCESGLGQLANGEGMISMNRGFLYAGVSNIMYSVWKVSDRYTSELMISFYKYLLADYPNQISYAQALRLAKLDLINKGRFASLPVNWAGFMILSD